MILLKRLRVQNFKLLGEVDLAFPRQGSVLIEGLNESGKSTLFESVYYALYGAPLIAEGKGKGTLESAIRYGADAATVELWLEIDEVELQVKRSIRRGKATLATLIVRSPGASEVQLSGVTAVTDRVVEELKGMDGEALLNSCFVEQKKLSKLEDLASGQRKDSVRKLLNLDRMTEVADRLKLSLRQEEQELVVARDRLELARVAVELPAVVGERAALEASLRGDAALTTSPPGDASPHSHALPLEEASAQDPPLPLGEGRGDGRRSDAGSPNPGPAIPPTAVPELPWVQSAADLRKTRASAASANRRARLMAAGSALALVLAAGLYFAALPAGLLLLLPAALLALGSAVALRSLGAMQAAATDLESKLRSWRDDLVASGGELGGRKRNLEGRLGIDGETLELEECRREVDRLSHQIAVKRKAAELIEGAMERIARMVLPNTERNLAQILPLLTAGRYHEARIGEDYQIQVWDDAAGRYVSKGVFSGGARDQFSLSLRLAFAMATLPQELGAAPGFLFLDEPLSAFDVPRTEALVQLITTGQVAGSFSQIFVVSHNRSFSPDAFQYRLVMRDGRVVESNLPTVPW